MTLRDSAAKAMPHGIMFHHFHGPGHLPSQGSLSAEELSEVIEFIGTHRVLSAPDWLERFERGTLHPDHVCLSFDDNLRCQFDIAVPVLRTYNVKAFFFIYSNVLEGEQDRLEIYRDFRTRHFPKVEDFYTTFLNKVHHSEYALRVERGLRNFNPTSYLAECPFYSDSDRTFRYIRDCLLGAEPYHSLMATLMAATPTTGRQDLWMDKERLFELHRDGHILGLHSHSHPTRIEKLDRQGQLAEFGRNQAVLAKICGVSPTTASYPCNSYNQETLSVMRSLGVRLAFRANMELNNPTPLEMGREDHANVIGRLREGT